MKELILYIVIAIITSFVLSVGILIGITSVKAETIPLTDYLIEKTQKQYFEIQELKLELQRCEFNAGVKENIVLSPYVRGERR